MTAATARYGLPDASDAFSSTFAAAAGTSAPAGTSRSAASRFCTPQNAKALAK